MKHLNFTNIWKIKVIFNKIRIFGIKKIIYKILKIIKINDLN